MKKFILLIGLMLVCGRAGATYCSDAELCYLFAEGSGTVADSSGNSRTGTLVNTTWETSKPTNKPSGNSVLGNADNEYMYSASRVMTAPSAMSAVLWGNVSNPQPGTFNGRMISERNSGGWFFGTGTNNILRFFWAGSTALSHISNTNAFTTNTWQHFAVTYDGSNTAANAKIYVNAREVTYATTTNGASLSNADAYRTYFYGDAYASAAESGVTANTHVYMNQTDVGIFSSTLTPTQISDIYDHGIDGTWATATSITHTLGNITVLSGSGTITF